MLFEVNPRLSWVYDNFKKNFSSKYKLTNIYKEERPKFFDGDWEEPSFIETIECCTINDIESGKKYNLGYNMFKEIFRPICKTYKFKNFTDAQDSIFKNKLKVYEIHQFKDRVEVDVEE